MSLIKEVRFLVLLSHFLPLLSCTHIYTFLHLHLHKFLYVLQYLTHPPPGSRTAWSSIVMIQGAQFSAQFWYAGERLEQAREDAAEVALKQLTGFTGRGQQPPPAR